jgi:radical SAM protein with 4Fe4S-binding SPASM domain
MMKAISIRLNNRPQVLVYSPNIHQFRIEDSTQIERIKLIEDTNLIDESLDDEFYIRQWRALSRPPAVAFNIITNRCNMNCQFCYAGANQDTTHIFKPEWILKLKRILPETSFNMSTISGGEPFLYFSTVRKVRREYGEVEVFTNGSLIDEFVVDWMLDTKTKIYVNLDYHMTDFQGHEAQQVRERLNFYCEKTPELKKLMAISIVMPTDAMEKVSKARKEQQKDFEKDVHHLYNFIPGERDFIDADIDKELDRVESGEVKLLNSIFERELKYLKFTMNDKFNLLSCDPSITINYKGDIYLCHTPASRADSNHTRLCTVDEFTLDLYYKTIMEWRLKGVCPTKDCSLKYLCSGICWANLKTNPQKCPTANKLLPAAMYLLANYSNFTPEQITEFFKDEKPSKDDNWMVDRKQRVKMKVFI